MNNVRHAFSLTLPSRFLRVWCRKRWKKMGFSHESIHKQEVFAREKNTFLLLEKGTTPANHKLSVFGSVTFFCLMSQNNEMVECGAGRRAEADLSLRHCLCLNVNHYIYL